MNLSVDLSLHYLSRDVCVSVCVSGVNFDVTEHLGWCLPEKRQPFIVIFPTALTAQVAQNYKSVSISNSVLFILGCMCEPVCVRGEFRCDWAFGLMPPRKATAFHMQMTRASTALASLAMTTKKRDFFNVANFPLPPPLLLKVRWSQNVFVKSSIFQNTTKKNLIDFCPDSLFRPGMLCTHLSRVALRIIKTNHMYLVYKRAEIYQIYSVVFWKLMIS